MIYHPCFFQNIDQIFIRSCVDTLESSCCATCADVTTPAPTTTESQCFDTNNNCDGGLLQLNEANKRRYVCLQLPINIIVQRIGIVQCFHTTHINLYDMRCLRSVGPKNNSCSYAHIVLLISAHSRSIDHMFCHKPSWMKQVVYDSIYRVVLSFSCPNDS